MRAFAQLCTALEDVSSNEDQHDALAAYFESAPPEDASWALYYLSGERPKRLVRTADLREWATEASQLPEWLFEESHAAVGDLAETIALLLPDGKCGSDRSLHYWIEQRLLPMQHLPAAKQKESLLEAWSALDHAQRFVWNKWITGTFRANVSRRTLVRAVSGVTGVDPVAITLRLSRRWEPSAETFVHLTRPDTSDADRCRPYPFCLAHPLSTSPEQLGPREDWQIEWKRTGVRAQLVRRGGRIFVWSVAGDLITDAFPEVRDSALVLPDGIVLDGEIVAWRDGVVAPNGKLRRRLGRKSITKKLLREEPACFLAFDLLEDGGEVVRTLPLAERRARLERALEPCTNALRIRAASLVTKRTWDAVSDVHGRCRDQFADGLILKRLDDPYGGAVWRSWKIDPYKVEAVLLYAESGGRRGARSEFTFAVWDGDALVPFTKAAADLDEENLEEIDGFVRNNTTERFGPVRAVAPELVFEIGFEGIRASSRRKSGVAVRAPRIIRRLPHKEATDADTLNVLRSILTSSPA